MSTVSAQPHDVLSNRIRTILFTLAIVGAIGAGYAYRTHLRYKNVSVHEPGVMYRSAWVDPDVMANLIERHQIRAVVNLCEPGEMGEHHWAVERETVRNAGAHLLELPIPTAVDPADPRLSAHLAALSDPANYPMLVHCRQGIARTSKFLAIYDMSFRGKTAEESLASQPLFGRRKHDADVHAFCHGYQRHHRQLHPHANGESTNTLRR